MVGARGSGILTHNGYFLEPRVPIVIARSQREVKNLRPV
jgi:hypothetical protein